MQVDCKYNKDQIYLVGIVRLVSLNQFDNVITQIAEIAM